MENNLNQSVNENSLDKNFDELAGIIFDGTPKEEQKEQEDNKPPKKGKSTKEQNAKTYKEIGLPESSPLPVSTNEPLAGIEKLVQGEVEGGQPKNLDINFDDYAPYFGDNLGMIGSKQGLDKARSLEQSNVEQFKNAAGRVIANVVPEVVSQLANALDLEDYANTDLEMGNAISNTMKSLQEDVNEALPIYRENPDTNLDVGDFAYWMENGSSLVTSMAGFVGAGYVTGGIVNSGLTRGAKVLKWMQGAETGLSAGNLSAINKGGTLLNAMMLNQAESVGIGVDVYKQMYAKTLKELESSDVDGKLSKDDIEKQAREKASNAAASAVNFNKVNILLNLTSANLFLKPIQSTRNLLVKNTLAKNLGIMGLEGVQEGTEEVINMYAENQAMTDTYGFKEAMADTLTAEGAENFMLGFIGGAGQTALTKAGKSLPLYNNIEYRQAYTNAYDSFSNNPDMSDAEKDAKAKEIAFAKVGTDKSRVSANELFNARYVRQQDLLSRYNELGNTDKLTDIAFTLANSQELTDLQKEIEASDSKADKAKKASLEALAISNMAYQAFETGTTENLLSLYKGYLGLTDEQAKERGLLIEGEEPTNNFRTRAQKIIKTITDLETIYNNSLDYINNHEVYNLEQQQYEISNKITDTVKDVENLFNKVEERYKDNDDLHPSREGGYRSTDTKSGFDLSKTAPKFRKTPYYRQIHKLLKADADLRELLTVVQNRVDTVTTPEYQEELRKRIIASRKAEANRKISEEEKKRRKENKKSINKLINNLANRVNKPVEEVNTNVDVVPLDTAEGENIVNEGLPLNIDVVSDSEEDIPVIIAEDNIVSLEKFSDLAFDANVRVLEKAINDKDFAKVKEITNAFTLGANDFSNYYGQTEGNKLNRIIQIANESISKYEKELEKNNLDNIQAETLKKRAQELIDELNEEQSNDSVEQTNSPAPRPDYAKVRKQTDKLISILEIMADSGIDVSNFKDVITAFENNTSKEEVVKAFNQLKNLFNVANGINIEGTYEEIMFDDAQRDKAVEDYKTIAKFSIPTDTYTSALDNKSKDLLNQYNEIAKLNGLDATDSGLSFDIYNQTASNKLAYLAKLYNINFTPKISKTGKPYISVTKEDIGDLLNSMLDQRVLNPNIFKVGTEIRFIALESVTLEDGSIRTAEESTIDNAPIGVELNGEIIEGLYLHDTSWINATNVDNTPQGIEEDRNKLRLFRSMIINTPGGITSVITNRSIGVPILNDEANIASVYDETPELKIGIVRNGEIYSSSQITESVINKGKLPEGKGVLLLPVNGNQLALGINRAKMTDERIDSVIRALDLYLEGKQTDVTKQLESQFGINILNVRGIEEYLNNFISLSKLKANNIDDYNDALSDVPDNVSLAQFSNGQLLYGTGQSIGVNYISKNKNTGEERAKDLEAFRKHLQGMYSHINIDKLAGNTTVPFITSDGVTIPYETYDDFAKDAMLSPYLSITLNDGTKIYTIQNRLEFDLDTALKLPENEVRDLIKTSEVLEDNSKMTEEQLKERTTLPNGKSFSFDDVTDEDFSPAPVEENNEFDYLLENSNLIKGLTVGTQNSIIKSIVNDVYTEFLDNKDQENFTLNVKKQVKLAMDGFRLIQDKAINSNHPKKEFISNQINTILTNEAKITDIVRKEVTKKRNVKTIQTLEDSNNEVVYDEDAINNKSLFVENDFTIDPRTTLTDEVREFLEGVRDRRIVNTSTSVEYVPRTNLIGLNNYIPADTVFNDLLSILSKNNDNTQFFDNNAVVDEAYQNMPTYIANIIKTLESNIQAKPYLIDVINKLRTSERSSQNAFATAFNKLHTNHIYLQSTYDSDKKSYVIRKNVAASRNVTNLVLSEWQNNLNYNGATTVIEGRQVLKVDAINQFKDQYKAIVNGEVELNYEVLNNWLSIIGINIPENLYTDLYIKGFKQGDFIQDIEDSFKLANGVFRNIYIRALKFDTNIKDSLDLDTNNIYEDNAFRILARLSSMYRGNLFNDSFKNGNGDTIHGYTNSRYVLERALALKSDVELLKVLKSDIFSRNSTWLTDLIIERNGVETINKSSYMYKYFKYYTSDSLKVKTNKLGKTIDRLSPAELEKYHLGLFYNNGQYVGKKSNPIPLINVVYPTMSDKANTVPFQVVGKYYSLTEEGLLSDATVSELVDILIKPEADRILAFQNNPDRVKIKEYRAGAGKFLLFPELNNIEQLWEGDNLRPDMFRQENQEVLKRTLRNYLTSMTLEKLDLWRKYGIILQDENTKEEHIQYIDDKYKQLYNVQGVRETAINYVINTTVANMNFQQLFIGDPAIYFKKDAIGTAENQGKRLAGDNAGKNQIISAPNEKFNVLVMKDVKTISTSINYLRDLWGDDYANEHYGNITASDAQAYTTLKEHLNIMFKKGEISESNMTRILNTYNTTRTVNKKDVKILQPMKPVYVNNIDRDGINSRLYLKYSSIPLIEQFTKGRGLDNLREYMENNEVDLAIYESGVKVGLPSTIPSVFDDNQNSIISENIESGIIRNIPREGHGIQNEVPYNSRQNEVNDGTQQSKLLFTNILDVEGFVNPETNEKVNGKELSDLYLDHYRNLFKNKFDRLIKELDFDFKSGTIKNIKRLQKILVQEGLGRNYSSNDLASLGLNELGTNFTVPLWINNSSSKIESLLNSIVDNRIRKRTFRGKSFVLASSVGTNLVNPTGIDLSKVIKVGDWDGTLKAVTNKEGQMTYAEVIIPFKFWDNNGNLLNVNTFMNDDGTLDMTRLPQEALEIFGYRIPTSGLNLLSTIKVVAFLPDSMGDIVIAPDDFITQMGSDFDVDKLYTHMYNTHYNSLTNSLEIITDETVKKVEGLRKAITKLKDKIKANENLDIANSQLQVLSSNELLYLRDIENAVLENKLLDIHKAVLNNPNSQVQKARSKALSFGNLPKLATLFNKANNNKWFTPLSNTYQIFKYNNARAGKIAVGIFSLDMVFNSVMQYVDVPMYFTEKIKTPEGTETRRWEIKIAGYTNNSLNTKETVDVKGKFKSDTIEGFMTAALDNEKEQLLGKLNINNNTFDFIRAMSQLGYSEDITLSIINQPSIIKFNEDVSLNKTIEEIELTDLYKDWIANTSLETIQSYIGTTNTESDFQKAIMALFQEVSKRGKELKILQSAINTDSSGIGKSIFYSMRKANQIVELPTATSVLGANRLIGDYINLNDDSLKFAPNGNSREAFIKDKLTEGYVLTDNILIKPNSLGGFASVYATLTNNQLWQSFFPYSNSKIINTITSTIAYKTERPNNINDEAKEMTNTMNSYKSLLSTSNYNLFSNYNSILEARTDLLYDRENHLSLGSIITDLIQSNTYSNLLLERLQIGKATQGIDTTGKIPTEISYFNAGVVEMDEEQVINSFIDMIVNDRPLKEYNGVMLTSRELANKLITHQIITGGVQKSNQFIKFIPFEYLNKKGYFDRMNDIATMESDIDNVTLAKTLSIQYLQHNPDEFYRETFDQYRDYIVSEDTIQLPEELAQIFPFIILKEIGEKYSIYLSNGKNFYNKIDNLGWKGMSEYDLENVVGKSSVWINKVDDTIIQEKTATVENNSEQEVEESVIENTNFSDISTLVKVGNKPQTITITNNAGTYELKGYKVNVPEYPDADLFVGKREGNNKYIIVAVKNGLSFGINEDSIKTTLDVATDLINSKKNEGYLSIFQDLGIFINRATNVYVPNSITDSTNFLSNDRDTTQDNSPAVYNIQNQSLVKKFYLDDTTLSIEDKYRLILNDIAENSTNPITAYFADKLKDSVSYLSSTPLYIDTRLKTQATTFTSKILGDPLQIRVNPNLIRSEEEMREVLIEEMVHGILKTEISKASSPFVKSLDSLRLEIRQQLINKYGQDAFNSVDNKIKTRQPLADGMERDLIYNVSNLDEFITGVIKNKTFQAFMNTNEGTYTTKSLWEKFLKMVTDLLERLGVKKDSNLEAALHEVINLFDSSINTSLYKELNRPRFIRSIKFLNSKFGLLNEDNSLRAIGNPNEVASFINNNIVNVKATVNGNFVNIESNVLQDYLTNFSPALAEELGGIGGNLVLYVEQLENRVKKLRSNIKKAKANEDFVKAEILSSELEREQEKLVQVADIESIVELADKAREDLDSVETMMKRPMNSEDLVYARNLINFWRNAKENIFDARHYSSDPLTSLYGGIEGLAEQKSDKLFKIEKNFMEDFARENLNRDINLDEVFDKYIDINWAQKGLRDISTYDNALLSSIWASIKLANNQTNDEAAVLLDGLEEELNDVIPILKGLGNEELFEVFRQKTARGKVTNHLVNPYTNLFFKDRAEIIRGLDQNNIGVVMNAYVRWIRDNATQINLESVFPASNEETPEVLKAREELKTKLGEGVYNFWFKNQKRRLVNYNNSKEGYLNWLSEQYNLEKVEDIYNNQEALSKYEFWVKRNSPYVLEDVSFNNKKFKDTYMNFRNQDYYEVVPKEDKYLDTNFNIIANDSILLKFYNRIDGLFDTLKKYVPESQQKTLAYRGIPGIEKSIIEMYSERGMELGVIPILDAFKKSMQTSFSDIAISGEKELRIPIISDPYKEIKEYRDLKIAEFITKNNREPIGEELEEFEEDIVDIISRRNSFDLGKIAKVYTSLVLAHKHKSKIEDSIKVANTVLDSYQEIETRPDGTPLVNRNGVIQRKEKGKSFINVKESLSNYENNVLYGDVRDEEGKGDKIYTATEKRRIAEINRLIEELTVQRDNQLITPDLYISTVEKLTAQRENIGKTLIYSKAGDNVLKYIQIKLMGWNVLGGVSNMGFGWIANQIEAAGGQFFNKADLAYAYKLVGNSVVKNLTFNKVETDTAKKIRQGMIKWDVLKDASHELYTSSTPSSISKSVQWLTPYNMNQRTEYINQAPLLIALARKTKVNTPKGEINIWDGYDNDWNWKAEYGEEPKEVINRLRLRLDQIIKRTHGNYDNLSPLAAKRKFLGRAMLQFRTWLLESVAVRIEKERFDDGLGDYVKGRYRSVGTLFSSKNKLGFGREFLKQIANNYTFGKAFKSPAFDNIVDENNFKSIDAINMRKVATEVTIAINLYLFLLMLSSALGDDDDNEAYNILMNQGTRLKTDLLLYVNPMEARNILKDPIPATSVIKEVGDWIGSTVGLLDGTDEVSSGVHAGDSRFLSNSLKLIPLGSKGYSVYNASSQVFDKD